MKKILLILVLSMTLHAQEARVVPHLAQPRAVFDTWIYLANDADTLQTYTLTPYDRNGQILPRVSSELEPFTTTRLKSTQLFDSPLAAWFTVDGRINVSVAYQSPFYETMRAFVHETTERSTRFRVYASDWDRVFDGLAAVNANDQPAEVTVTHYNFQKEVLGTQRLSGDLAVPAMGKLQLVLGDPFGNGFQYEPNTYVELVSDQPLTVMALSGELPMQEGARMWILDFVALD